MRCPFALHRGHAWPKRDLSRKGIGRFGAQPFGPFGKYDPRINETGRFDCCFLSISQGKQRSLIGAIQ